MFQQGNQKYLAEIQAQHAEQMKQMQQYMMEQLETISSSIKLPPPTPTPPPPMPMGRWVLTSHFAQQEAPHYSLSSSSNPQGIIMFMKGQQRDDEIYDLRRRNKDLELEKFLRGHGF